MKKKQVEDKHRIHARIFSALWLEAWNFYPRIYDSKIYLIMEGIYENKNKNITINTTTSNLKDKYYNFIPTNFYFLTNEDLDNMLIKKELNEFLSLLI